MAITEHNRRDLFNSVEEAIGTDNANLLMELLPTSPAAHLVTRDDMHANTTMLRGEMAELRAELRGEMAELRGEISTKLAHAHAATQRHDRQRNRCDYRPGRLTSQSAIERAT